MLNDIKSHELALVLLDGCGSGIVFAFVGGELVCVAREVEGFAFIGVLHGQEV